VELNNKKDNELQRDPNSVLVMKIKLSLDNCESEQAERLDL